MVDEISKVGKPDRDRNGRTGTEVIALLPVATQHFQ
jgi:hypothetical protein